MGREEEERRKRGGRGEESPKKHRDPHQHRQLKRREHRNSKQPLQVEPEFRVTVNGNSLHWGCPRSVMFLPKRSDGALQLEEQLSGAASSCSTIKQQFFSPFNLNKCSLPNVCILPVNVTNYRFLAGWRDKPQQHSALATSPTLKLNIYTDDTRIQTLAINPREQRPSKAEDTKAPH